VLRVRFLSFVAPPDGGAAVSELDAERDGVALSLDGDRVIAERAGKTCIYPITSILRIGVDGPPKKRGRPKKEAPG
jgi:hypothetical protein